MKILFVCCSNPYDIASGGGQRSNILVNSMRNLGHMVEILFLHNEMVKDLPQCNNCLVTLPKKWQRKIHQLLCVIPCIGKQIKREPTAVKTFYEMTTVSNYDYVFFRYLTPYYMCGSPIMPNMIVDVDDLPWQYSECIYKNREYTLIKRVFHYCQYKSLKNSLRKELSSFKFALYSNPQDCKKKNERYVPNIPFIKISTEQKFIWNRDKRMLFIGTMSHVPNYEGINHFIKKIWPAVQQNHHDIELVIVGRNAPQKLLVEWNNVKGVKYLGYVEDISKIYEECPVVISPIYSGAGTNIKVLEALYYNRLCILSRFSCRGFEKNLHHNEDVLVCDNDFQFIQTICDVFNDINKFRIIANNGYQKVLMHYSQETIQKRLKEILV